MGAGGRDQIIISLHYINFFRGGGHAFILLSSSITFLHLASLGGEVNILFKVPFYGFFLFFN